MKKLKTRSKRCWKKEYLYKFLHIFSRQKWTKKPLEWLHGNGICIRLENEQEGEEFFNTAKEYHWGVYGSNFSEIYNAKSYYYPCEVKVVLNLKYGYTIVFGSEEEEISLTDFMQKVETYYHKKFYEE